MKVVLGFDPNGAVRLTLKGNQRVSQSKSVRTPATKSEQEKNARPST